MELDMKVELKVKDKSFSGNIRQITQINENDLTKEFTEQPSTYAWFATLQEIANADVESMKFDLDVLKANLDTEKREKLAKEAEEKATVGKDGKVKEARITEAMVSAAILTDKRFVALHQELSESSRQLGILKAIVGALNQRSVMLIQIGSTKRQELSLVDFGIDLKKVRNANQ